MVGAAWIPVVPQAPSRLGESDCETFGDGFLGQPVNATTSLAFVIVGVLVLGGDRFGSRSRTIYGLLAVATGVGSVVFHGPSPSWGGLVHDAPLVAIVAFVAVDAASDLAGRRLPTAWWVVPTLLVLAVSEISEPARLAAQTTVTVVAVVASLLRARARPRIRTTILTSLTILGAGALVGTLSRTGTLLCDPDSFLQGHGVWHVLAAVAVWWLAPVVGAIHTPART